MKDPDSQLTSLGLNIVNDVLKTLLSMLFQFARVLKKSLQPVYIQKTSTSLVEPGLSYSSHGLQFHSLKSPPNSWVLEQPILRK